MWKPNEANTPPPLKIDEDSFTLSTLSNLCGIPELNRQPSTQSLLLNKSCGNRGGKIDEDSFTLSTSPDLCGIPELNRQPSSQSLLLNKSCGNRGGKTDGESYNLSTPSDLWGISQLNRHPSSQSLLQNKSCGNRELSLDGKQPPALASSSVLSNKDVDGYLKAILRNVISIKNRIKNLEDHNIALEAKVNELDCVKRDKTENLPNDLSKLLPLSTFDEFNMLEEKLSDEMTRKQLVSYLQRVGGTGFRQVATLVLKKLFTDALAAKFSFLGQRGKLSFKTSRICSIIFENATSTNLSGATEENVTKVVADWLRHANSRDKRKRQNPSVQ
ncbi:uncharacterized protein LOC129218863 [Uloborus diversus]|uniref:uncharacterized protein LOC129218863 n=1 Tax=Uloborus diversus TaxID=327109 RepID=UPI0024098117|nr:uncharacterized protein LOC129218863 [Uloborus diversus]